MTDGEFLTGLRAARERRDSLLEAKGKEYVAGDSDMLGNFKRQGARIRCKYCGTAVGPELIWLVYFMKHADSILEYVNTGKVGTEGIEGRLDDLVNYLDLFNGLVAEKAK